MAKYVTQKTLQLIYVCFLATLEDRNTCWVLLSKTQPLSWKYITILCNTIYDEKALYGICSNLKPFLAIWSYFIVIWNYFKYVDLFWSFKYLFWYILKQYWAIWSYYLFKLISIFEAISGKFDTILKQFWKYIMMIFLGYLELYDTILNYTILNSFRVNGIFELCYVWAIWSYLQIFESYGIMLKLFWSNLKIVYILKYMKLFGDIRSNMNKQKS